MNLVFVIFGILGNVLVIIFVWKKSDGFIFFIILFLFNLVVVDLLVFIIYILFYIVYEVVYFEWLFGVVFCKVVFFLIYVCMYFLLVILMVIVVERYLIIFCDGIRRKIVKYIIVIIWIIVICFSIF